MTPDDVRLAWELVSNITDRATIMRRRGMSFDDFDAKLADVGFKSLLANCQAAWNSELSVNQRVQIKAALLTEDTLLDVYAIVKDSDTSPGQKLEAFQALAKAGEVGAIKKDTVAGAPAVKITFNLPGKPGVTIDATPVDPALETL